jgi:hypothetical protein
MVWSRVDAGAGCGGWPLFLARVCGHAKTRGMRRRLHRGHRRGYCTCPILRYSGTILLWSATTQSRLCLRSLCGGLLAAKPFGAPASFLLHNASSATGANIPGRTSCCHRYLSQRFRAGSGLVPIHVLRGHYTSLIRVLITYLYQKIMTTVPRESDGGLSSRVPVFVRTPAFPSSSISGKNERVFLMPASPRNR